MWDAVFFLFLREHCIMMVTTVGRHWCYFVSVLNVIVVVAVVDVATLLLLLLFIVLLVVFPVILFDFVPRLILFAVVPFFLLYFGMFFFSFLFLHTHKFCVNVVTTSFFVGCCSFFFLLHSISCFLPIDSVYSLRQHTRWRNFFFHFAKAARKCYRIKISNDCIFFARVGQPRLYPSKKKKKEV